MEFELPGIVQSQVSSESGATFASTLRSVLRSDPDVIMVGEIRDQQVAHLTMTGALTGHLMLATLHTEDAATAVVRTRDLASDPMIAADALRLVLGQRLVRKLCPKCSIDQPPDAKLLSEVEQIARAGGLEPSSQPWPRFRGPAGCNECNQTGYRGRLPIAEVLDVTPEIRAAIKTAKDAGELRRIAISQGMTTIFADSVRRAWNGTTTLEEVMRVAPK